MSPDDAFFIAEEAGKPVPDIVEKGFGKGDLSVSYEYHTAVALAETLKQINEYYQDRSWYPLKYDLLFAYPIDRLSNMESESNGVRVVVQTIEKWWLSKERTAVRLQLFYWRNPNDSSPSVQINIRRYTGKHMEGIINNYQLKFGLPWDAEGSPSSMPTSEWDHPMLDP